MERPLVSAVIGAALVVAVAYGVVGVVAADDVTLEITVVDSNGQPVDGVDVSVTWADNDGTPINETTTADGRVLVDVPDGADVSISVDDDENYVRNRPFRVFDVGGGQTTVPVTEIGRATIVVEGGDGPVEGAEISVQAPGGEVESLTTNASGVARTGPLEQRKYTLEVTAPRHLQKEVTIDVTNVEKTERIEVQRANVDATFTVVDDHFEPPQAVENADVRIESLGTTLTTDSNGVATVSLPVNADHRVRVSKDGYDAERVTVSVAEDPVEREISIQREPTLSLESVNRRVVIGESTVLTVTDEYDEPVAGASVSVNGETVGTTGGQGQVRVPIDTAGEVRVEASASGATASITIEGIDPDATDTPADTPAETPTETATLTATPGDDGPGFGVVAGLLAVLAAGLLARRR